METKLALFAGVIPGAVTLLTLAVMWRWRGRSGGVGPLWVAPVLVGLALVLGDFSKFGMPELWPDSNTYRFPHVAALLTLAGLVEALTRLPAWGVLAMRSAAYAGVVWMLSEGYSPQVLSTAELVGLIAVASAGMALVAHAADRGAASLPGWRGPSVLAVVFVAAGPLAFLGGLSYGMHVATAMIAFTVAGAIAGFFAPRLTLRGGGVTSLVGVVLALILGMGVQSEPVSIGALLALGASPAAIGVAALVPGSRRRARVWFSGLCMLGVLALAYGQMLEAKAALERERADDPYADYYG